MKETKKLKRAEVIDRFTEAYGMDISKMATGIRIKTTEYAEGGFAPEKYGYKITFTMFGQKKKFGFWPETVGYQGS